MPPWRLPARIDNAAVCRPRHICVLLRLCVGCVIVQADNAPDCGVAQGVVHGVTVRHGENQEEVEGEVEQEVEGNKEEDNNQTPVRVCVGEME